jgi:hypothetical protein
VYNTGLNALAIAAVADGDASDSEITLTTDEVLLVQDVEQDSVQVGTPADIQDLATVPNAIVTKNVTINDTVAPELILAQTMDVDNDGWIDHIKMTFSETVNDAYLAGYNGTDKLSLNATDYWKVEGYTVIGLNFTSNATEATTATTDATTRGLSAALDANGKVINVGDAAPDNVLWLMVAEQSGPDFVAGDTQAVPSLYIAGGDSAKVADYKPNTLVSVTKVPTDQAGPAIMSAMMTGLNSMQVVMSEAVADTLVKSGGTWISAQVTGTDFWMRFGNAWANLSLNIKDITQTDGVLDLMWPVDQTVPAGNIGYIGLNGTGVIFDQAATGVGNTQTYTLADNVGIKVIEAYNGTGGGSGGPIGAPADLVLTDVPDDNGYWMYATFTASDDNLTRVKSYQFYREMITETVVDDTTTVADSTWVYTAVIPAGYVNSNNKMVCLVPSIMNGTARWAVLASTGDMISDVVAGKDADVAVATLVNGAEKAAAGDVISDMAIAVGGPIDNIAPSAFLSFTAADADAGIMLSWTAPEDHGIVGNITISGSQSPIYGAESYEVYRTELGTDNFVLVGEAAPLSTSYVDNVANSTTVYTYMVKAVDSAHEVATSSMNAMAFAGGADWNSDGIVALGDLVLLGQQWGKTSSDATWVGAFDLNTDNQVGLGDLVLLGQAWTVAGKVAKAALPVTTDVALGLEASYDEASSMYYVNINVSEADGFNGVGFTMSYDADALQLVKDGITGLGVASVTRTTEAGMIDVNSYFADSEFSGTITVAFQSKGQSTDLAFELVNASVSIDNVISSVSKLESVTVRALPTVYALSQNFPNPFNPTTTIEYSIPQAGNVDLVIYNLAGQKVRTLINEHQAASYNKVVWDGKNDMGESVGAGMYFYKLVSGNFNKIQKMTLIK